MSIRVVGADQLTGQLDGLADQLPELVADTTAGLLADALRRFGPVRTGRLVGSVSADARGAVVGVPYAVFAAADTPFVSRALVAVDQSVTTRLDPAVQRQLP